MDHHRAVNILKQPHARLIVSYTRSSVFGRSFHLEPGGRVNEKTAAAILRRPDVTPVDDGLFPGRPQSWTLVGQQ